MGYCAVTTLTEKTDPLPKNRVGVFSASARTCAGQISPQPLESQQGKQPAPTETVSGVRYYGYRFYHPELGRWVSRDPIGEMLRSSHPVFDHLLDITASSRSVAYSIPNSYLMVENETLATWDFLGLSEGAWSCELDEWAVGYCSGFCEATIIHYQRGGCECDSKTDWVSYAVLWDAGTYTTTHFAGRCCFGGRRPAWPESEYEVVASWSEHDDCNCESPPYYDGAWPPPIEPSFGIR